MPWSELLQAGPATLTHPNKLPGVLGHHHHLLPMGPQPWLWVGTTARALSLTSAMLLVPPGAPSLFHFLHFCPGAQHTAPEPWHAQHTAPEPWHAQHTAPELSAHLLSPGTLSTWLLSSVHIS